MNIAEESRKRIKQLELVVTQLQTRIGQIAASYELEIAVLKVNLRTHQRYISQVLAETGWTLAQTSILTPVSP